MVYFSITNNQHLDRAKNNVKIKELKIVNEDCLFAIVTKS
jgi:hypothetical protein